MTDLTALVNWHGKAAELLDVWEIDGVGAIATIKVATEPGSSVPYVYPMVPPEELEPCNCVVPEQSCPACRETARQVYCVEER